MSDQKVIVALDYSGFDAAMAMAAQLDPAMCRVKVGKELFTACGPQIVNALQDKGFDVFLDLKFHDIPNTTAAAVCMAAELGVWMVNVHAGGGEEMLRTCVERLASRKAEGKHVPLLIGVTVLTSMNQEGLAQTGVVDEVSVQVMRLAGLAKSCGLDGVVCSAEEAGLLKEAFGADFKLVTPGIRPAFAEANDQKRIVTPAQALKNGSDYLVIGRPVTQAVQPVTALSAIQKEIAGAG